MKLKTGIERKDCCGCAVCAEVCPKSALAMAPDADGFEYPELDASACVDCGMCASVCPVAGENPRGLLSEIISTHAFVHNDEKVFSESSSGGAFTAIAQAFCDGDEKCAIFGVESASRSEAAHSEIESLSEIGKFRKSKYLQSRTSGIFLKARARLRDGEKVLFSGTACQIAALKLFLKKDYENLLTVDVACHGVSNSKLTESYLRGCEKFYGKKISGYSFRNKGRRFGTDRSSFAEFRFADGSLKKIDHDILYWGFVKGLFIRESCGSCRFSGKERAADFTIADFWGIERLSEEFSAGRGCSLVCANTERAAKLLPEIAALGKAKEFEIAPACEYVVPLKGAREPSGAPRAEFLKFAREEGMLPALKKFVKMPSLPERALSFAIARAPMPAPVRNALKKFRAMLQK